MRDMTAANLRSAHGGESMAHMRYLIWAEKADSEGLPNVARLFRAVARAEQAHATGHFRVLKAVKGGFGVNAGGGFGLGSTSDNLAGAIAGETFEVEEMYPAFITTAELQKETAAVKSMQYALSAEKIHAQMFAKAKQAVEKGKDAVLGTVRICPVCGHTIEGDAPDRCPICNAIGSKYVAFA